MSAFLKRQPTAQPTKPIPEEAAGGGRGEGSERALDKSFGYSKNFAAKYELGKEVGRGHFGHTCWAKCRKGELKNQQVAVKLIAKAKVCALLLQIATFDILCFILEYSSMFLERFYRVLAIESLI